MYGFVFKLFAAAILLLISFYYAADVFRNGRKLDARIEAARREQEERAKAGVVEDPYAQLAEVYMRDRQPDKTRKTR